MKVVRNRLKELTKKKEVKPHIQMVFSELKQAHFQHLRFCRGSR